MAGRRLPIIQGQFIRNSILREAFKQFCHIANRMLKRDRHTSVPLGGSAQSPLGYPFGSSGDRRLGTKSTLKTASVGWAHFKL
jgi:hypothetical protein